MSNFFLVVFIPRSPSTLFSCSKTPMLFSTSQSTMTAMTSAMPAATDNRKDTFSADQGSRLATVSLATRGVASSAGLGALVGWGDGR
jgi:hypothetical protein